MEEQDSQQPEIRPDEPLAVEELNPDAENAPASEPPPPEDEAALRAAIEALVYVAEEPLTVAVMATVLGQPAERIQLLVGQVAAEFEKPEHGLTIREVAGGYKMATKAEHHEVVRAFAKVLKPPLKLSLAALETLSVIAYKQPVTVPEIQEIRGVQGGGVVKTLLDRKLIVMAGRKNVVGKPILYRTSKDFLIQFGLKDLSELPSLKEFEEIRRFALSDAESPAQPATGEPGESYPAGPLFADGGEADSPLAIESGEAAPSGPEALSQPDTASAAEADESSQPPVASVPEPDHSGEEET